METETTITTADGATRRIGERAFNYYDRKWGVIGEVRDNGWFDFAHDDGTRAFLNGERIASAVPAWMKGVR